MNTRKPFEGLPSGCVELDFDVNIVPLEFTFCTISTITGLDPIPMTFNLIIPDLVVSPFCPCFPTAGVSGNTTIAMNTQRANIKLSMYRGTDDCCMPALTMNLDLQIPCMPLVVTSTVHGTMRSDIQKVEAVKPVLLRREDTCALEFNLDLAIPCAPLGVEHTGTAKLARTSTATGIKIGTFAFRKLTNTCVLSLDYDLNVPCLPFGVTSTGTAKMTNYTVPADGKIGTFSLTKWADTCVLDLNYDLKVPCLPFTLKKTGVAKVWTTPPNAAVGDKIATFHLEKYPGTCVLDLQYDLRVPCMPFGLDKRTLFTPDPYVTHGNETLCFSLEKLNNCTLKLHAQFFRDGLSSEVTYVRRIVWDEDNLQLVMHRVIGHFNNGRLWTLVTIDPYVVVGAVECG